MSESSVPVVPGYFGEDQSDQRLKEEAEKLGWVAKIIKILVKICPHDNSTKVNNMHNYANSTSSRTMNEKIYTV